LFVALLFWSGTISGALLGLVGLAGIVTTFVAWSSGRIDCSWSGLGVGFGYLSHLVMVPGEVHLAFVGPVFWVAFAWQCWVRWHLGRCCTLTGPVYCGVRERGPYAWVRHPLAASSLVIAALFALEFPSWWNLAALAFIAAVDLWCCLAEEKFLSGQAEYRAYAQRVRWRLLPGVW
jgi:protein-S-isoprenylcysteine O-methyltransferase Ste14